MADKKDVLHNDAVDLQYQEEHEEPIVNWEGPVKPESQRAHRALAFHLLYAAHCFDYKVSINDIVADYREGFDLEVDNDAFATTLARGAMDERESLDKIVEPYFEHWKLDRIGCATLLILRLALWERLYTDMAPTVIINEAIELAKSFAEQDAFRFVNGILDEAFKAL